MICQPNLDLPQRIDLKFMKESHNISDNDHNKFRDDTDVKTKVSYEQKDYDMLPTFKDQFQHLNDILSLNSNDYLACRWNLFLDNVPDKYIRIRLYFDYKKSLEHIVVRRKVLNGKFYGVDNKLAPFPQLSDPRSLGKKIVRPKKQIKD